MARFKYILFLLLLFLFGCENSTTIFVPEDHIVVEGWIKQDGHPVVILHRSYALGAGVTDTSLTSVFAKQMLPFARVTVSDGVDEVVLTGKVDTNYMPPYIYTSVYMVGEVGKTYSINATYEDYSASASSTLFAPVELDSILVESVVQEKMRVSAYMSAFPDDEETYYALFVRELGKQQFKLCPMGTFSSKQAINGVLNMMVKSQNSIGDGILTPGNFDISKGVYDYMLQVARVDKAAYEFLDSYSAQLFSQGMIFMSTYGNIPTNIVGGLGYFSAQGVSTYQISLKAPQTYYY